MDEYIDADQLAFIVMPSGLVHFSEEGHVYLCQTYNCFDPLGVGWLLYIDWEREVCEAMAATGTPLLPELPREFRYIVEEEAESQLGLQIYWLG